MAGFMQNLIDVANQGASEQEIQTAQPADFNLQKPNALNIQELPKGFGSYLQNILPDDIAAAAGAFSRTMQQIKNIEGVPIEKFAQVGGTMETAKGLNLINGTNVPTNKPEAQAGLILTALGSGPYNTYTYSDFFGCMSCLPYPWKNIQSLIQTLQTTKLFNIYHELLLAVEWKSPVLTVQQPWYPEIKTPYVPPTAGSNPSNPNYQPDPEQPNYDPNEYTNAPTDSPVYWEAQGSPEIYNWYYTLNVSIADAGGGYTRGTAPPPTWTIVPNNVRAGMSPAVDPNDLNAGSNGSGSFGRLTSLNYSPGSPYKFGESTQANWTTNVWPNTTPPIYPPTNRPPMPTENVYIQASPTDYLPVQSNGSISTGGTNVTGPTYAYTGLVDAGTVPWPAPMNSVVQQYIDQANTEILSIRNTNLTVAASLNTLWNNIGQQLSIEQRARTIGLGSFPAPNTPPNPRAENLNPYPITMYSFTDGVYKYAQNTDPHMSAQTIEAISNIDIITGQSTIGLMRESRNKDRLLKAGLLLDNTISDIVPPGLQPPLLANGKVTYTPPGSDVPVTTQPSYPVDVQTTGYYNTSDNQYYVTTATAGTGVVINGTGTGPDIGNGTGNGTGTINGIGTPLDTGGPAAPGSLAESPYQQLIPVNLNPYYTSGILTPATYSVAEAIDQVITCNCDCWVH
jgi:hypothetical protein